MKKFFTALGVLSIMLIIIAITSNMKSNMKNSIVYTCDYHALNLFRTEIDVKDDDGKTYSNIKGNYVKIGSDPLVMTSTSGESIGTAGDEYHLISQDSHSIITDRQSIEMVGKVKIFGEEYYLYDTEGKEIGTAVFNFWGTNEKITDEKGNIIAEYNSGWLRKDYTITISKDSNINNDAIILIFASYASDFHYDE